MTTEDHAKYAKGYADGAWFRSLNKAPSKFQIVGIDDYCHGFRAAFFDRNSASRRSVNSTATVQAEHVMKYLE